MLENLLFYLYFKNLSFPLSKENNLPAKGISDSYIILFIHLLYLCNIKMHLDIIKLITQNDYKTRINSLSFLALFFSSPFHLMKHKFSFLHFNESNKHHRLRFLICILHEGFATTHVSVHCQPFIFGSDTLGQGLITTSDECIWNTFGSVTRCFRTLSHNIIKQLFLTKIL